MTEWDQKVTGKVSARLKDRGPLHRAILLFTPVSIVPELLIPLAVLRVTGYECLQVSPGLTELVLRQS